MKVEKHLFSLAALMLACPLVHTSPQSRSNRQSPDSSGSNQEFRTGPKEWKDAHMDQYLANYPNGHRLTFRDYTNALGVQNFDCNIGIQCLIGQYVNSGLQKKDWMVLLAVQEWTMAVNQLYQALTFMVTALIGIASSMVADLVVNQLHLSKHMLFDLLALENCWLPLASAVMLYIPYADRHRDPNFEKPYVSEDSAVIEWAQIGYVLRSWEADFHESLSQYFKTTMETPISNPGGLSQKLAGGWPLAPTPFYSSVMRHEIPDLCKARVSVMILHSMNAFVTRGKDPCNDTGPNGAWHKPNRLSYCGPDKIMMNIILAKGKKAVNKIHNAALLSRQYGVTTEWLTVSSLECHQKFQGKGRFDPRSGLINLKSDCISDLPVCDFTDPKNKRSENEHTVSACRRFGVPI